MAIRIPTYDNRYKYDIQAQFGNDSKFVAWCNVLAQIATSYITTLDDFSNAINLSVVQNSNYTTEQKIVALNCIGSVLNLPTYEFFVNKYGSEFNIDLYALIIRGAQANRQYDGTSNFIITTLAQLFGDTYEFIVEDNQDMSVNIILYSADLTSLDITIYNDGWFVPKTAGVQYILLTTALDPSYWNDGSETGSVAEAGDEYQGAWGVTVWGELEN